MSLPGYALIGVIGGVALLLAGLVAVALARTLESRTNHDAHDAGDLAVKFLPVNASLKALVRKHVLSSGAADETASADTEAAGKTSEAKGVAVFVSLLVSIGVAVYVANVASDILGEIFTGD